MQEERFDTRDRAYSAWHRRLSTRRFVGIDRAQLLAMIDLDGALYVEYDNRSREPLALIETARDVGQPHKSATVTARLARRAGLPCYCVLYRCDGKPNPADPRWLDIARFRVKRLWPRPEAKWRELSPGEWVGGRAPPDTHLGCGPCRSRGGERSEILSEVRDGLCSWDCWACIRSTCLTVKLDNGIPGCGAVRTGMVVLQ